MATVVSLLLSSLPLVSATAVVSVPTGMPLVLEPALLDDPDEVLLAVPAEPSATLGSGSAQPSSKIIAEPSLVAQRIVHPGGSVYSDRSPPPIS
jgi:hypothetical protein